MRLKGHAARTGVMRNAYGILAEKPEGRRPVGRPRSRWKDNIRMDLGGTRWKAVDWMNVAQDRDQRLALVKMVMDFHVP
jgi:hypothetical protein